MAGEYGQCQGEFLRHGLPDINRIPIKWFKRWLISVERDLRLTLRCGPVNQREALGNRPPNRLEGHRAALLELRLEISFQTDDLGALTPELHLGDEPVEGNQVEAPQKLSPFLGSRFNPLPEWFRTQLGNSYEA